MKYKAYKYRLYPTKEQEVLIAKHFGISYSEFKEPDLDYKSTALAVVSDGKMFKNLKLVK